MVVTELGMIGQVLLVSLVLGTGLPVLCFTLVVAGVGLGITFVVASGFGYELDFAHGVPTLVAS
ncbi:hypothetical protein [Cellulomonas sp. RIT-PI-Y]|uniref:hypothetical protein n=1 Tax=Cellulomonas sp. RIT-PI-Y TaxID=3035297 RepID=UPI0021DAA391|nr:hypothetical protein [Cellulomonas sp. RIT-PI-Y]